MKFDIQRRLTRAARSLRPLREVTVERGADLVSFAHGIDKQKLRMRVPTDLLRMQGAYRFDGSHPFVQALAQGEAALTTFYADHQPADLAAFYEIKAQGRLGADLPPWEMPWYGRKNRLPPAGELSLGAAHGVSFYGPCSEEKVSLEMQRLQGTVASIAAHGYDPDGFGDIEGYVLLADGEARFFVRGGKHRAAVLAHLGYSHVPVAFRTGFPRVVDAGQAAFWPLVAQGQMNVGFAQEMLAKYCE